MGMEAASAPKPIRGPWSTPSPPPRFLNSPSKSPSPASSGIVLIPFGTRRDQRPASQELSVSRTPPTPVQRHPFFLHPPPPSSLVLSGNGNQLCQFMGPRPRGGPRGTPSL